MALESPDAKSFLLAFGHHLARTRGELFADDTSTVHIEQRVGTILENGEVIGAEIHRIVASPFSPQALSVLQEVGASAGHLVGVKVQEWVHEHLQLSVAESLLDLLRDVQKLPRNLRIVATSRRCGLRRAWAAPASAMRPPGRAIRGAPRRSASSTWNRRSAFSRCPAATRADTSLAAR
jgi:hypothetical protein